MSNQVLENIKKNKCQSLRFLAVMPNSRIRTVVHEASRWLYPLFIIQSVSLMQFSVNTPASSKCVIYTSVQVHCTELVLPIMNSCQQLEAWNDRVICHVSLSLSLSTRRTPHWSPWQCWPGIFARESISLHAGQRLAQPPLLALALTFPNSSLSAVLQSSARHKCEFTQPHAHNNHLELHWLSCLWLVAMYLNR